MDNSVCGKFSRPTKPFALSFLLKPPQKYSEFNEKRSRQSGKPFENAKQAVSGDFAATGETDFELIHYIMDAGDFYSKNSNQRRDSYENHKKSITNRTIGRNGWHSDKLVRHHHRRDYFRQRMHRSQCFLLCIMLVANLH